MTRDSRTLSAVFMAVLLVLASGTAVSLAVTGSSTTDAGTNNVALDDTTTAEATTTAAGGAEETTTMADGEQASVTINEQETEGERVVIESATLPEGGFIAIHDSSVSEAPLASVLGNSVYLEAGTHENVTITLARPITESQTLVAMPHLDTNDNQVYDFVLSTGNLDGPYTADGEIVIDAANVSVAQDTTTTAEEAEETTTEEAEETTTEEVVDETTTEAVEETTTEEVVEETTTEEVVEETTTEEVVEETTTEEVVEETTTEEVVEETTTTEEADGVDETTTTEAPAEMEQFVFKIEQMNIDRWSFVIGDEEEPDRTETISNVQISDRRVVINLSEVLRQSQMQQGMLTTVSQEEAEEQLEENLTQDIPTVRYVIQDVQIENVTFVITAPEDMELPEPPMTTTPEETTTTEEVEETTTTEEVVEETTTPEETTTEEVEETTTEVVEETTTEEVEETTTEEVVEETTTEEVEETTTTEEVVEETTTEEVEETTTTEEVVEETTTTEAVEETTTTAEPADLDSFEVSGLDAPSAASVGDTIEVSATISNPNDQEATQAVAFRLEGTVLARQTVTLGAGEETTVTFEIDTTDVPPGQYIHGVYTQDFGELAVITLEEPTAEETTTAAAGETTTAEATTTAEETTTAEA